MKLAKQILVGLLILTVVGCNRDSGDRVIVNKFEYDLQTPERFQVVVFKWPGEGHPTTGPVEDGVPKNYIKRLLGLPGEIIAVFFGQLFRMPPGQNAALPFDEEDKGIDPGELWKYEHTHATGFSLGGVPEDKTTARMKSLFETAGKFEIIRKPPEVVMAMRRIVHDNDYQAKDLKGIHRWDPQPESQWQASADRRTFQFDSTGKKLDWLNYQHLVVQRGHNNDPERPLEVKPQLITDFTDYNAFFVADPFGFDRLPRENWAGDLMLECTLNVKKAEGEFMMQVNRGSDRFEARWNLSNGECSLWRIFDQKETQVGKTKATDVKSPGSYDLRFANFDSRLMVWVNRALPFDLEEGDYPPTELPRKGETSEDVLKRIGPTEADLHQPAGFGARDTQVEISHVRLWRDTYYTGDVHNSEAQLLGELTDPKGWSDLKSMQVRTMYVQPGHFLCLGDNSTASSDSRSWGLVAERLLLGRALAVYWPPSRLGPIQ